jgi:DNA-binding IclR family transcriptional regulator
MTAAIEDQANKHTIPVIDKMMDVLSELERHAGGVSIRELTATLSLPRTTIYRILNTLRGHEVVRRADDGAYHLGRRLLSLAAHTSTRFSDADLASVCQPFLDRLAAELGEGVKLSIIDEDGVLVLAAAQGRREYALTVAPGQRMPIHAGAAGKLLLAYQTPEAIDFWLSRPLPAYTNKTITDRKRLRSVLASIKRLGWSQDKGEGAPSIQAYAAPVFSSDGGLAAALSVPFLAGTPQSRMEKIKAAAIRAARAMSQAMPRRPVKRVLPL